MRGVAGGGSTVGDGPGVPDQATAAQASPGERCVSQYEEIQEMAGAGRDEQWEGEGEDRTGRSDGTATGKVEKTGGPASDMKGGSTSPAAKYPVPNHPTIRPGTSESQVILDWKKE